MAYPRLIPSYDLYGDSATSAWADAFNFEWIPQRSAPYQWVIQPHRHEACLQLLYLTAGNARLTIDDVVSQVCAPCLIVVPCGHVHAFRFSRDVDGPVVTVLQKALESLAHVVQPELVRTMRQAGAVALADGMPHVAQLMPIFKALEQEATAQAHGQSAAGLSLMMALLVQVGRIRGLPQPSDSAAMLAVSRKAGLVERFRALLETHFRTQHSVQTYAGALGVTPGQLSRVCREVLGMSGLDVINQRLLHEAQRGLTYTNAPIRQLASELGFADDAYFSRYFRKHAGLSPKAFRAQVRRGTG